MNRSIHLQLPEPGGKNMDLRVRYRLARCVNANQTSRLYIGGVASRLRRTREGQVPIPGSYVLPCMYNSDKPRTKTVRTVWKPPHHCFITDWLELVQPAAPGSDKVISTDHESIPFMKTSNKPADITANTRNDTAPHYVETPFQSPGHYVAGVHRTSIMNTSIKLELQ